MDFKKFFNYSSVKHEVLQDGVERYIYTGTNIQVVEYHFSPNQTFPEHKHDDTEQMGYLISGKMGFRIGGEEKVVMPGEYYHAPVGVMHSAWTMEEASVLLDIFSPPRKDLA
jgi:quercetin dioxygenase-like cupin family protein